MPPRPPKVQTKFAIRRINKENGEVKFAGHTENYGNEYTWVDNDGLIKLYKTQAGATTAIRNSWKLKRSLASREHGGGDDNQYIIEIVEYDLIEIKAHEYKSV